MKPRVALVLALLVLAARPAAGQSRQYFSIQASGAWILPAEEPAGFESDVRLGYDVQVRYTPSRFSVGIGYQRSTILTSSDLDVSAALEVAFIEPRYVFWASGAAATYIAGRAGAGRYVCDPDRCSDATNAVAGGGLGLLFKLGGPFALDLGGQYFAVFEEDVRSDYFTVRLGLGVGL
jgi:hypothetical protein